MLFGRRALTLSTPAVRPKVASGISRAQCPLDPALMVNQLDRVDSPHHHPIRARRITLGTISRRRLQTSTPASTRRVISLPPSIPVFRPWHLRKDLTRAHCLTLVSASCFPSATAFTDIRVVFTRNCASSPQPLKPEIVRRPPTSDGKVEVSTSSRGLCRWSSVSQESNAHVTAQTTSP